MATNITDNTVELIQQLVRDSFDANATLDRIKSELNAKLACPIISGMVHKLAHEYSLTIGDGVGDLIEPYNESVDYGDIPKHVEKYSSVREAIEKVYDIVLTYQTELNIAYKSIFGNGDINTLVGLEDIIKKHNKYAEAVITWKDIVDKYGDSPSLDVHMKNYDMV